MQQSPFRKLRLGWIVGILLHNDAVESEFVSIGDGLMHGDFWEMPVLCRWRWRVEDGFEISIFDHDVKLDEEQWQFIQNHITKKYNVPFDDRGYLNQEKFIEIENQEQELTYEEEDKYL